MARLFSENFEGTGYENAGWTEVAEAGCSVNEDQAAGTAPGGGSQVLYCINVNATNNDAYAYSVDIGSDQPINYVRFYFVVDFEGLADGQLSYICGLYDSGLANAAVLVRVQQVAGVLQLAAIWYTGGAFSVADIFSPIALDTWYRVEFKYDATNLAWEWKVDGVSQGASAMTAAVRAADRRLVVGEFAATGAASSGVVIDLLAWDSADWIGPVSPSWPFRRRSFLASRGRGV